MNTELKYVLDRADRWPPAAQEALLRAARAIEQQLTSNDMDKPKPSLREVMLSFPPFDVDFERVRVRPPVRDVDL